MSITFEGRVRQIGDRLIVPLPADASGALPSRGQVAVEGEANGHSFATVLEPDGRKGHWVAVDDGLRETLALEDGDTLTCEVTPTETWPEPEIPEDLGSALDDAPDLADTWVSLTPMARWEWVRWVQSTRSPSTRERRVEVSVSKLRDGKRRPCCFDLSSCTDPELSRSGKLIDAG
ncbi:YdeI/OmpD-associated family protein [Ornithinimicrobium sp. F0845]|uniref:YdeI/OmpD-associated family protein n=1 Tax=Ornithinimicrobium sp. F0845 TaxID=2926412 RepID=UPI001FF4D811|nr:YdeI/OmpD-associated family protein [Ornithinimicrobium sp. F0845]MCK0110572.1 YdeI/OmpD-associated family protein [Ornithinimicrobium sp. F0845]